MGRMVVYPHRLEQMSQTIQSTAQDFQQLSEDLMELMKHTSSKHAQVHQLTQSLCEWHRISRTLLTTLQEQANFLNEKAQHFRQIHQGVIENGTVYRKLQNVHGVKISSPHLMLSLLTPVYDEKRELFSRQSVSKNESHNEIDDATEITKTDTSCTSTCRENDRNIFEGIEFINPGNEEEIQSVKMKLKHFILENGLVS